MKKKRDILFFLSLTRRLLAVCVRFPVATCFGFFKPSSGAVPRSPWLEYCETIIAALIAVLFIDTYLLQIAKIPSGSMMNTLFKGDRLIVNKFVFSPLGKPSFLLPHRAIRRGDVVAFKFPGEPSKKYVKRVIALPGEEISVVEKTVHINGVPLEEPYKVHLDKSRYGPDRRIPNRDDLDPVLVPEGSYFLMGDNRDYSNDSRDIGPVGRAFIIGKPFLVLWSYAPFHKASRKNGLSRNPRFLDEIRWERTFKLIE